MRPHIISVEEKRKRNLVAPWRSPISPFGKSVTVWAGSEGGSTKVVSL